MPARKQLPRNAKRLPKGTSRSDFEPEVLLEYDRDKARQYQEARRKKLRHRGYRQCSIPLGKEARLRLSQLCKDQQLTQSDVITNLLLEN